MTKHTNNFEHESLQDKEAIVSYLKALTKGIEKGEVLFSDDEESILLRPNKISRLRIRASQSKKEQSLRIKLSWLSGVEDSSENSPLFIKPKKNKQSG